MALPSAYNCRMRAFSLFGRPDGMGPAGTSIAGRCPKARAPMSSPGTILSQTPSRSAPSNISWDSAIPVAIAMTSLLNRDSSMPARPCVMPSHIAGTPPANWATPPASLAAALIHAGNSSNGWCADSRSL